MKEDNYSDHSLASDSGLALAQSNLLEVCLCLR